jgi:predicted patatin/cPLA2 family phospholipase
MVKKRALVIGPGGLYGAYSCGAVYVLGKKLGRKYFHRGYACSAGAYPLSFFFSGQYKIINKVLRHYLDGHKLVDLSFWKIMTKKALNLEYMEKIFHDPRVAKLDVKSLLNGKNKVIYVATDIETGRPVYFKPNKKNIFRVMTATCSLPLVHPPVKLNRSEYIDGGLSDPYPIKKAIEDGCDEVIVLCNYPKSFQNQNKLRDYLEKLISLFFVSHPAVAKEIFDFSDRMTKIEEDIESYLNDSRVKVIRPATELPLLSDDDTNQQRIDKTFDLGMKDAEYFLRRYNY